MPVLPALQFLRNEVKTRASLFLTRRMREIYRRQMQKRACIMEFFGIDSDRNCFVIPQITVIFSTENKIVCSKQTRGKFSKMDYMGYLIYYHNYDVIVKKDTSFRGKWNNFTYIFQSWTCFHNSPHDAFMVLGQRTQVRTVSSGRTFWSNEPKICQSRKSTAR